MWYYKEKQQVIPTLRLVKMVTKDNNLPDDFTYSEELGVYPLVLTVTADREPVTATERYVYNNIVEDTALKQFTAEQSIEVIPESDVALYKERMAKRVRAQRDALLAECDWTQARDVVLPNDTEWQAYRQALRDITDQSGFPFNITWPTKP